MLSTTWQSSRSMQCRGHRFPSLGSAVTQAHLSFRGNTSDCMVIWMCCHSLDSHRYCRRKNLAISYPGRERLAMSWQSIGYSLDIILFRFDQKPFRYSSIFRSSCEAQARLMPPRNLEIYSSFPSVHLRCLRGFASALDCLSALLLALMSTCHTPQTWAALL